MRSSTATGTTATAELARAEAPYRGRFAPSPTGLLHVGSLVTALASYLEARRRGGCWLLRIEDVDLPRNVPGSADAILRTLERLGLEWDEEPVWQSHRQGAYEDALQALQAQRLLYGCDCSRKDLAGPYPGTCRGRGVSAQPHALRFLLPTAELTFDDRWQGERRYDPIGLGDPVVRRRDGLTAYQLAVVVDDAAQAITDVVRGGDLIDSTPWQIALQAALGLPRPGYAHVPLITEPDGRKLAKSRRSFALDAMDPAAALLDAFRLLGQSPPDELRGARPRELLAWAAANWRPEVLENRTEIRLPELDLGSEARLY